MNTILAILFGGLGLFGCYVSEMVWPDSGVVALFVLLFGGLTGYTIGRCER